MGGRRRRPGHVKPRTGYADGREAYTGMCEITPGQYVSAGTFPTYEEARDAWMDKAGELRRGIRLDPRKGRTTFRDFAAVYLDTVAHTKANTKRGYRGTIARQLIPAFGDLQLTEIGPEDVAAWVRGLRDQGYAASTIRSYKSHLSAVMTAAVHWGYGIAVNPCLVVKVPKEPPARIRALSRDRLAAPWLPGWRSTTSNGCIRRTGCSPRSTSSTADAVPAPRATTNCAAGTVAATAPQARRTRIRRPRRRRLCRPNLLRRCAMGTRVAQRPGPPLRPQGPLPRSPSRRPTRPPLPRRPARAPLTPEPLRAQGRATQRQARACRRAHATPPDPDQEGQGTVRSTTSRTLYGSRGLPALPLLAAQGKPPA